MFHGIWLEGDPLELRSLWTEAATSPVLFSEERFDRLVANDLRCATLRIGKVHRYYADVFGVQLPESTLSVSGASVLDALIESEADLRPSASEEGVRRRCRLIAGENRFGFPLYWPRQRAARMTPGVLPEIAWSGFGPPYWWLGPSPGGIHFDRVDSILSQVAGIKYVAIWSQDAWPDLYPNPVESLMPHHSRVGPWHLCPEIVEERFPKVLRHRPKIARITPGTNLYLPAGWPHAVLAEPRSLSLTCSRPPVLYERVQRSSVEMPERTAHVRNEREV